MRAWHLRPHGGRTWFPSSMRIPWFARATRQTTHRQRAIGGDARSRIDAALRARGKAVGEVVVSGHAVVVSPASVDLRDAARALSRAKPKAGTSAEVDEALVVGVASGKYAITRSAVKVKGLDGPVVVICLAR